MYIGPLKCRKLLDRINSQSAWTAQADLRSIHFADALSFTKQQNFGLVQIESICRRENVAQKLKFVLGI